MVLPDQPMHISTKDAPARIKSCQAPRHGGRRDDGVAQREPVHEARNGNGAAVADHGREGRQEREGPDDEPATRERAPFFRDGAEPLEDCVRVDEENDDEDVEGEQAGGDGDALDGA